MHKNGPLGKEEYYVIMVEFQFRGSAYIHAFLWVPKLTKDTKDEYIEFVDSVIRADLPDPETNQNCIS